MAREKRNALGYWYSEDAVDENGKIISLGHVERLEPNRRDRRAAGASKPERIECEELRAQQQGYIDDRRARHLAAYGVPDPGPMLAARVWPVEDVDLCNNYNQSRAWSAKRERLELALAENAGTFTPSQAYIEKHSQVAPKELPDPSPYREWPKARRDKELALAYADGRFTPSEAYLAAHPELEAKAAVLRCNQQVTPPVVKAVKKAAEKITEAPVAQAPETVAVTAPQVETANVEKHAHRPVQRKQRRRRCEPKPRPVMPTRVIGGKPVTWRFGGAY